MDGTESEQIRATRRKSRSIEHIDELVYKANGCAWTRLLQHAGGNMLRNWEENQQPAKVTE